MYGTPERLISNDHTESKKNDEYLNSRNVLYRKELFIKASSYQMRITGNQGNPRVAHAGKTDRQLVTCAQDGDKSAFNQLVERYETKVTRIISSYIREDETIKDIAQEVFISTYRALGKFRNDSSFFTWLYRITVNTTFRELGSTRRKRELLVSDDQGEVLERHLNEEGVGDDFDQIRRNEELQDALKLALDTMPLHLREVFSMREEQGLKYDQIAEITGCAQGTVKSRIFRAREQLASKLERYLR